MRTTCLQLGLALLLLGRGPLCGLFCEIAATDAPTAAATQHAGMDASPCHESPAAPDSSEPADSDAECPGCDTLTLAKADGPTAASILESPLVAPNPFLLASLGGSAEQTVPTLIRGRTPPPDILLLKSTLLL